VRIPTGKAFRSVSPSPREEGGTLAKVAKAAYHAFQANITVARGFVELHFMIEDLLERGGQKTIGVMMRLGQRMIKLAGIDWREIEKLVERQFAVNIEERQRRIGKAELERQAKDVASGFASELESIFQRVKPVATAYERGLLEQALVVAVSALETYIYDVTVEATGKNKYLRDGFTSKLHENFRYSHLAKARGDVAAALGEVIADSYKFYDVQSTRKHLKVLLRGSTPLDSREIQNLLINLLAYRNLITHNAGIVDKEFKQKTGHRGKVGSPLRLHRDFVSNYIKIAEELVASIQHRLEKTRA